MSKLRFRGKNGFGALVRNTVAAKTSLDGEVLKIISEIEFYDRDSVLVRREAGQLVAVNLYFLFDKLEKV